MADLVRVTVSSTFTPEVTVTESDILGGERAAVSGGEEGGLPPGTALLAFLKKIALSVVRPKAHVESDLLGTDKTIAPYGDPLPWWIGLPILVLVIGAVSAWIYSKVRRAVK